MPVPARNTTWVNDSAATPPSAARFEAIENRVEYALTGAPTARVRHSLNQSIANNTETVLVWDTEVWDTDNIWGAVPVSRFTCRTAGKYLIFGNVLWGASATGQRRLTILHNGAASHARVDDTPTGAAQGQDIAGVSDLVVNDYLELRAFQTSGAALDVLGSGQFSFFGMFRLG